MSWYELFPSKNYFTTSCYVGISYCANVLDMLCFFAILFDKKLQSELLLSRYYSFSPKMFIFFSIFIVNEKTLPWSTPSDYICSLPPLCSIRAFEIMRPRPIPSEFIFAVLKSLPNCLQRRGISSFVIPFPLSTTWTISYCYDSS